MKDKLATVLQERELVHMLDNTRWLLTVPAIWNENGKQMMSNAVVMVCTTIKLHVYKHKKSILQCNRIHLTKFINVKTLIEDTSM